MIENNWIPEGSNKEKPALCRIYDYLLGGNHNLAVDREVGDMYLEIFPTIKQGVQANREFLRRVVQYSSKQGIKQFLDLGSGFPAVGNVHNVAQKINRDAKIVYVDIDQGAVSHYLEILQRNKNATAIIGNYENPEKIIANTTVQKMLNFSKPIAILFVFGPQYITNDYHAYRVVDTLKKSMTPGSYLAISHSSWDGHSLEKALEIKKLYKRYNLEIHARSKDEVMKFFDDLEMVPPGLVNANLWKSDKYKQSIWDIEIDFKIWAGVGLKK